MKALAETVIVPLMLSTGPKLNAARGAIVSVFPDGTDIIHDPDTDFWNVTAALTLGHTVNDTVFWNVDALLNVIALPVALVNAPVNVVVPLVTDIAPSIESAGLIVTVPVGVIVSVIELGIVTVHVPVIVLLNVAPPLSVGHVLNATVPSKVGDTWNVDALLSVTVLPLPLENADVNVVVPLATDIYPLIESTGLIVTASDGDIVNVFKLGIVIVQLPDTDDWYVTSALTLGHTT